MWIGKSFSMKNFSLVIYLTLETTRWRSSAKTGAWPRPVFRADRGRGSHGSELLPKSGSLFFYLFPGNKFAKDRDKLSGKILKPGLGLFRFLKFIDGGNDPD